MESTNKLLSLVKKECEGYSEEGDDYNIALGNALERIIQRERNANIVARPVQNEIDKDCYTLGECLFQIREEKLGKRQVAKN